MVTLAIPTVKIHMLYQQCKPVEYHMYNTGSQYWNKIVLQVGISKITIRIPENSTLKGKRRIVSSICSRVQNNFNVSISEVSDNDSWQISTLGICYVSNSIRHTTEVLMSVVTYIDNSRMDIELIEHEQTITQFR